LNLAIGDSKFRRGKPLGCDCFRSVKNVSTVSCSIIRNVVLIVQQKKRTYSGCEGILWLTPAWTGKAWSVRGGGWRAGRKTEVDERIGERKGDKWASGKGGEQRGRVGRPRGCASPDCQTRSSYARCEVAYSGVSQGTAAKKECIVCMIGRITGTARSRGWSPREKEKDGEIGVPQRHRSSAQRRCHACFPWQRASQCSLYSTRVT